MLEVYLARMDMQSKLSAQKIFDLCNTRFQIALICVHTDEIVYISAIVVYVQLMFDKKI